MSSASVQRGFVVGRGRAAVPFDRAVDFFLAVARLLREPFAPARLAPARAFFFGLAFLRGAGCVVPAVPAAPDVTRVECFGR